VELHVLSLVLCPVEDLVARAEVEYLVPGDSLDSQYVTAIVTEIATASATAL